MNWKGLINYLSYLMTEPLIENSQQNIPISSSEQTYSENNAPYTESPGIYDQNQQIHPEINQPYQSQNQPYQNQNQPYQNQSQPYQNQNQPDQNQNQPYQNQNQSDIPSNDLSPMYKESPDNIVNSLPILSEVSYGYPCIFTIYLVQSLINIGIIIIEYNMRHLFRGDIFYWYFGIDILLCLILFASVRKYMENYGDSGCDVFLFILFFIFKLGFFVVLNNSDILGIPEIYTLGSVFFHYSCSVGAIYLALIIYSLIKKEISLLVSFVIAFFIALICFAIFFFINAELNIISPIMVLVELIFLFVSILVAQKTDILENKRPIHNILMFDYYKYFIIMVLSFVALLVALFMLYCFCLILGSCCSSSKATYTDNKGNIFDQYKNSMGIKLSKKPAYVGEDGKFYDKHHKEIKEDNGCHIF